MGDGIRLRRRIGANGLIYNSGDFVQGEFVDLTDAPGQGIYWQTSQIKLNGYAARGYFTNIDYSKFSKLCFTITAESTSTLHDAKITMGLATVSNSKLTFVSGCNTNASACTNKTYTINIDNGFTASRYIAVSLGNAQTTAYIHRIWLE